MKRCNSFFKFLSIFVTILQYYPIILCICHILYDTKIWSQVLNSYKLYYICCWLFPAGKRWIRAIYCFLSYFCRGRCSLLLHRQMVGQKINNGSLPGYSRPKEEKRSPKESHLFGGSIFVNPCNCFISFLSFNNKRLFPFCQIVIK